MAIPKNLPKAVLDSLAGTGWKKYEGDNPMYTHNWINGNKVIAIYPSSMGKMFHLDTTIGKDQPIFVHQQKLINLIRGEND